MAKREYTQGDLTVKWDSDLCIHCGVCSESLPQVFKPKERPWVQMQNASNEEIINTVEMCPSGALSIKTQD